MQIFSTLVILGLFIKIYMQGNLIDEFKEKFTNKIEYLKKSNLELSDKIDSLKINNSQLLNKNNLLSKENNKCKSVLKEYNINIDYRKISSESGLYNEVFKN